MNLCSTYIMQHIKVDEAYSMSEAYLYHISLNQIHQNLSHNYFVVFCTYVSLSSVMQAKLGKCIG
jgi:hypothetical protein